MSIQLLQMQRNKLIQNGQFLMSIKEDAQLNVNLNDTKLYHQSFI